MTSLNPAVDPAAPEDGTSCNQPCTHLQGPITQVLGHHIPPAPSGTLCCTSEAGPFRRRRLCSLQGAWESTTSGLTTQYSGVIYKYNTFRNKVRLYRPSRLIRQLRASPTTRMDRVRGSLKPAIMLSGLRNLLCNSEEAIHAVVAWSSA